MLEYENCVIKPKNMTAKRLEIFIIVTIIAVIGIIYGFTQKPNPVSYKINSVQENIQTQKQENSFAYKGVDGKNALDLLKEKYAVETQHFDFGDMVISIGGVKADENYFWAFYVNDQVAQVGASSYITKSTDDIKWKLEEINK